MLFDDKTKGIAQAYLSMLGESHFKVGDKVKCKASGMKGTVTKLDKEDGGEDEKYYTVKQDSGKVMKYAPNELSKLNESKMDPVNPKAVKKKFDDRMDKDIDNDGDVDDSDEYLHKRRKAISKAVKKEAIEIEMQKKSKMNGSDDDDDDEDMVAKGNDKMKVKKNSKKDDEEENMKESRESISELSKDLLTRAKNKAVGRAVKADVDGNYTAMDVADKQASKFRKAANLKDLSKAKQRVVKNRMKEDVDESSLKDMRAAAEKRAGSVMKPKAAKPKPRPGSMEAMRADAEKRRMREDFEWNWDAILEAPEEELDAMIEEMSDDDLESFVSEFEQLDEISTRTLARAANAAADPDTDGRHDAQKFADYAKRKKGSKAAKAVQGAADGKGYYPRPGHSTGMDKMRLRQNRSTNANMVTKSGKLSKTAQKGLKTQMKESDNWYQASTNSVQPMRSDGRETLDPRAPADRAFANAHRQDVNIKDYPGKDKPVTNAKAQAPVRPGEKRNPEPRKTLSDIRNRVK